MTQKELLELAGALSVPEDAKERLRHAADDAFLEKYEDAAAMLGSPQTAPEECSAEKAYHALEKSLQDCDPDGMKMLALYLDAAGHAASHYRNLGIPDAVYSDTMKCFARFLGETGQKTGRTAYDRAFWTWRQTSLHLFRLGTLEFEYRTFAENDPCPEGFSAGDPILSVHIPSDAVLSKENLEASYRMAETFFGRYDTLCYAGAPRAFWCESWLLAPALEKLLSSSSGILRFRKPYRVYADHPDDPDFYDWLFDGKREKPLPCRTGLQRRAAAYLDRGGKIGVSAGWFPMSAGENVC